MNASSAITACNEARSRLLALYGELSQDGGWKAVGERLGVSGPMAYRVAKQGYQPRDPGIRAKLGLPPLTDRLAAELLETIASEKGEVK